MYLIVKKYWNNNINNFHIRAEEIVPKNIGKKILKMIVSNG